MFFEDAKIDYEDNKHQLIRSIRLHKLDGHALRMLSIINFVKVGEVRNMVIYYSTNWNYTTYQIVQISFAQIMDFKFNLSVYYYVILCCKLCNKLDLAIQQECFS